MYKVVSQYLVGNYVVLEIDKELPIKKYDMYVIDGKKYDCVMIYDLPRHIAIKSNGCFVGKTVEFLNCIKD